MKYLVWGALFPSIFFLGCTGTTIPGVTPPPPPSVYALDLSGTIDGHAWAGIAVGSNAIAHDITIESKTDVNYMRILSCHRFEQFEDVITTGWFHANRGFEYQYNEAPGIEDNGLCVLRLQAFTKQIDSNGLPIGSAFGLMLFHNDRFNLPGENICNGADGLTTGTSICQSMAGLVERLKFKTQVVAANPPADGPQPCKGKFIDAQTWQYEVPVGECMAVFMSTNKPHQFAVHLSYGFNRAAYRGSK